MSRHNQTTRGAKRRHPAKAPGETAVGREDRLAKAPGETAAGRDGRLAKALG